MWNDVPTSDMQAGSLNSASRQQVPWPLENTPLPRSQPPAADAHAEHRGHSAQAGHAMPMDMPMPAGIPLQRVVDIARERGVAAGYGIALPSGMEGSTRFPCSPTIRATTPPCTSTSTAARFSPTCVGGTTTRWRGVQMGVVLHEGKLFGLGNQLLMLAVCLAILLSSASGLWIWWKRKPAGRLGVPPLRHELPRWKTGIAIMLALGVAFRWWGPRSCWSGRWTGWCCRGCRRFAGSWRDLLPGAQSRSSWRVFQSAASNSTQSSASAPSQRKVVSAGEASISTVETRRAAAGDHRQGGEQAEHQVAGAQGGIAEQQADAEAGAAVAGAQVGEGGGGERFAAGEQGGERAGEEDEAQAGDHEQCRAQPEQAKRVSHAVSPLVMKGAHRRAPVPSDLSRRRVAHFSRAGRHR